MRSRLTLLLVVIVIAPLAVAGWLGARIVGNEQVVVEQRLRELILGQLRGVSLTLADAVARYQMAVRDEVTPFPTDAGELRRLTRQSPYVLQYYLVSPDRRLAFPPVGTPADLTRRERESLQRTRPIWESGGLLADAFGSETAESGTAETGWHTWYWQSGLQWMLWMRDGQRVVIAEINRPRFLAELVAALPETDISAPELVEGRIRLLDSAGRTLYQWGTYSGEPTAPPVATLALAPPLGAWSLEYHAPADIFGSAVAGGFLLNLVAGLSLLSAVVIGLAYYFHREQSREVREAAQRVSFVNQVSHELKTPLTSIRMYAELLDAHLDDGDEKSTRYLGVIVSESQRLSRLIGNVLTFGRKQRGTLELHRKPGVVDDVLRGVLAHFEPSLEARQIEVCFTPGAGERVSLDADALEQILGNLISNVEKYAAGGRRLQLASHARGEMVEIVVADRGPGLPAREHRRIFEPFYRVDGSLTEGVSGTGIGLTISRDLARLHGGDLQLDPSQEGARFRLTLRCPAVPTEGG